MVKNAPSQYDCFGPDLTWNKQGWYIPIFPVFLININLYDPAQRFYPNMSYYYIIYFLRGGYYILYIFCHWACDTSTQYTKIPQPKSRSEYADFNKSFDH